MIASLQRAGRELPMHSKLLLWLAALAVLGFVATLYPELRRRLGAAPPQARSS